MLTAGGVIAGLGGCSGGVDNPSSEAGISLKMENNFTTSNDFSPLPSVSTAAGVDLRVTWDKVTKNLQCNEIDPMADVKLVGFLSFEGITEHDVKDMLSASTLQDSGDMLGNFTARTDQKATSIQISSLKEMGQTALKPDSDYVADSDRIYLLLVGASETAGVGTQTMMLLHPGSDSSDSTVKMEDGCNKVIFDAKLSTKKISVPKKGPWVFNWGNIKKDSTGTEVVFPHIDKFSVGFYEDRSFDDLEKEVKEMTADETVTEQWDVAVSGGKKSADLKNAKSNKDNKTFSGFDSYDGKSGTWAASIGCSQCQIPTPVFFGVLDITDN